MEALTKFNCGDLVLDNKTNYQGRISEIILVNDRRAYIVTRLGCKLQLISVMFTDNDDLSLIKSKDLECPEKKETTLPKAENEQIKTSTED